MKEWVDGPRFVEWVEEVRADYMAELSDSQHRAMWRFRQPGAKAALPTVDRICCALFLHIDEIPEDLWTESPNKGRRIDTEKRAEAFARIESGNSIAQVAREVGVHYETLRSWFYGRKAA